MERVKIIIKVFLLVGCAFYVAIGCVDDRYWLLWLLPVIYIFVTRLIERTAGNRKKEVGYRTIKMVMLVRYVLTPISIVGSQFYSGYGPEPSKETITLAIILMAYELIVVGVVISRYSKKHRVTKNQERIVSARNEKNTLIWFYILIAFIVIARIDIRFIIPTNIIAITNEIGKGVVDIEYAGFFGILKNVLRVVFGIALLNSINRMKTNNQIKVILSLMSLVLILSLYTSTGRWDTLTISFVGIVLLRNLYPKYSKTITVFIGSIMLIGLTSVTIYKFLGYTTTSISSYFKVAKELIEVVSMQFQAYFSGPRNVGLAIDMSKIVNIRWTGVINDLFGSFPGLSQFFDQGIRFNLLFNRYIYIGNTISQIIPLVGIGYNAFGFLLSPIVTVGFILLVLKLNGLYQKVASISDKYILLYMIIYTSMCMGMNIQILTNKYYAVFIPSVLLIFANRKCNALLCRIRVH
jgi:hypothetical protein